MESVVARELRERGRNEEAKIIYERVLKKQLEVVGENNHETIWTWMHLATCLMRLENFDQAIIYYNKAVKANRRLLGNQHPKTCLSWTKLGRIYYTMGDYTQGEERGIFVLSFTFLANTHTHTHTHTHTLALSLRLSGGLLSARSEGIFRGAERKTIQGYGRL